MLTRDELIALERSLRGAKVLSVYLGDTATDPAERAAWRRALDAEIERRRLDLHEQKASHAEREAFERCVALLREHLSTITGVLAPGWAAFVTPDGVRHAEHLPVPTPTVVAWEEGIRLAPYVRALKQHRPALLLLVDSHAGRLFRYRLGALERLGTVHAHQPMDPTDHMGYPPSTGFHSGTRGATAADEVQRQLLSERGRMMTELAERVAALAEPDSWIVIGGAEHAARDVAAALPPRLRARTRLIHGLEMRSSDAAIEEAAEAGATEERRAADLALVDEIVGLTAAAGKATLGLEPTAEALRDQAVERLCFTEHFLAGHPLETERLVKTAFEQKADVELVAGAAAERLDTDGGGIGARLRFLPYRAVAREPEVRMGA